MTKQVSFGSLSVGDVFTTKGREFVKTDKRKISCCQFHNAAAVTDSNVKIGVQDNEVVSVEVAE